MFGFQIILILLQAVLIIWIYQNQNELAKSRDKYVSSYWLADELRQSSDDLTRMARSYVATGNKEFEREYWEVLSIRNGTSPRPVEYNRIYWDLVSSTGQKPRLDGETISLHDLMVREGFTDQELALLSLAQKNSDGLVKAETIAMNAMKGLYEDASGNYSVIGKPNPIMANDLMNNSAYFETKAEIMKPIDDFYIMFEARTSKEVQTHLQLSNNLLLSSIVLSVFIFGTFIFSFIIIGRQITQREKVEKELYKFNITLEDKIKERTKVLEKSEAKLTKALEETKQINKFMVGRELKMVELKKQISSLNSKVGT